MSSMNQRIKNGFGMVSNTILREPELSLGEKGLYAYLTTYADGSNELYVSVNRMASECNIGVSTVKRYLHSLETKGVILRSNRTIGASRKTVLLK
jgi:predicted transcriptional regulator